ncbi:TlpA disulfide reductase family protein [uncultured Alistipes sp.]|uniref:TlpA family protein disulfide reductase n=1 Tax=uncultured Alistipes sp. TaxID=538949 RepID=UPI00261570D4|nr:TlpA disulfide reductase family protein [uncultured Alistipes sp.]
MKKKIILLILALIATVIVALFVIQIVKYNRKLAPIRSLPAVELQTLDSLAYNTNMLADTGKPSVIVCFHPDCDFCGMEADELIKHYKDLGDVNLLFVTFASKEETTAFLEQHPLDAIPGANVLLDPNLDFFITFDVDAPPMSFIYDRHQKLVKRHKGTVAVDQLKQYLAKCHE